VIVSGLVVELIDVEIIGSDTITMEAIFIRPTSSGILMKPTANPHTRNNIGGFSLSRARNFLG